MKRYLVFAGISYYPGGGWTDYVGSADTIEEAQTIAKTAPVDGYKNTADWWHVVCTKTSAIVAEG